MYKFLLLFGFCGFSQALYGGEDIEIEDAPYQVNIWERLHHKCGGSILNEDWILTIGSCIDPFIENFHVRIGSKYTNKGSIHKIIEVQRHAKDGYVDRNLELALIRVNPSIKFDRTRQPAKLVNSNYKLQPEENLHITGYGYTDGYVTSTNLKKINTRSMLLEDCVKRFNWHSGSLYPGMLCIDNRSFKTSSCSGDAGNPVLLNDGQVVAVTTSRYSCGHDDQPDIHVLVSRTRDWIKMITGI